ncbi:MULTISPECIES: DUF3429 family protein [Pseudoalteromonas]|uniref:DUF3429 domain-containing protein n=1 Tax=Pseudoalteromonas rubra TaxID=43658 RepID=A0A5S3X4W4_9GAMM|nr:MULTISPECIES: DUF3429 family protein [Pseudoalteromonas]AZZ95755.1 DUF3429 family protein [Pseudoalteromonas sp. R3]TMP39612.1 DUF3429 domain-containing protein [Pseudoalteromonas rubra]
MHPYFNHIMLAYIGFVPFLLCVALTLMVGSSPAAIDTFSYYSLGVLAFLSGSLWRPGEQSQQQAVIAILVIVPFPLLALVSQVTLLSFLAVSYWIILLFERIAPKWQETHQDYKKMRFTLTSVVFVSHLFMIAQALELSA